jgi:hypothetical protein
MGQDLIDDIDGTDVLEEKCALIYDQVRDEVLVMGPENGWKFAKRTYHGIDRDSITITSIANSSTSGDITITGTHALVVGDMVELDGDTGYDDEYDVTAISTTATFDVTATFVATGTGTAYWTSEEYEYRYAIPTSKKVVKVSVGGVELTDWIKRGAYILTNEESEEVDMDIIQAITDVTLFPDHFVKVLVLKLAIALHYNLTQDLNAIQLLHAELDLALPKAIAMDEKQKYNQEYSSSWVDAGNVTDTIE